MCRAAPWLGVGQKPGFTTVTIRETCVPNVSCAVFVVCSAYMTPTGYRTLDN